MPELITLLKTDIPFWLEGKGTLSVDLGTINPLQEFPEDTKQLMTVNFGVEGDEQFKFGNPGSISLGVKAGAHETLTPIWASTSAAESGLLKRLGIEEFFADAGSKDKLLLVLDLGASGSVSSTGSFSYTVLKASLTIEAGAEGALVYSRAFDKHLSATQVLAAFFGGMQLPSGVVRSPEEGEIIAFSYGGYLKLGAELSAGYELKGTKSLSLGELALSERYGLSVLGKIGVSASLAGSFSVEVRAAKDAGGKTMDGWARVVVKRQKSSQFKIAGDVNVEASGKLTGLPDTADEFLGAALGVNAKNFINVLDRVREVADFDKLGEDLDSLAKKFVSEWVGKGFEELPAEADKILARINSVVTSYQDVGDRAITLFDRYFSRIQTLTDHLNTIKKLADWQTLKGQVDPQLWDIVRQLTDGDPLGWALGQISIPGGGLTDSLEELKKRADHVLALINEKAHDEIRSVVALAQSSFGIDAFFKKLADVDTPQELEALATKKLGDFVARLVGQAVEKMSQKELKAALGTIQKVLEKEKDFSGKFYKKLQEAANQSFGFQLHVEYSRASERDALIDVSINLASERGRTLLSAAGRADFREVLVEMDPAIVRLNRGVLTHKATRQSSFSVNIIGWHKNWQYAGFNRVITSTEQQMVPETTGGITVFTQFDLTVERMRKKKRDEVHSSFLLRALGQSSHAVQSSAADLEYFVDALTEMSARYNLTFTDEQTSAGELKDYLAFAKTLGLDAEGATFEALSPMLPKRGADDYGELRGAYEVRYSKDALQNLLRGAFQVHIIRNTMRSLVLANYIDAPHHSVVGWAYVTEGVFQFWKDSGGEFTNRSSRSFRNVTSPIPGIKPPETVDLDRTQLFHLDTLFRIEEKLISTIKALHAMVNTPGNLSPEAFENALSDFGEALNLFDGFDQVDDRPGAVNTLFAVFDKLVELSPTGIGARNVSLELKSHVNDSDVTKMFVHIPA